MKIEDIMTEWKKDSKLDEIDLDTSSMSIPNLHSKWIDLLTKARQKQRSLNIKKKHLHKTLFQYYRGELNNPEDLEEIGREPLLNKPLNSDTLMFVDAYEEMINLNLKIAYQTEVVEVLTDIMKFIHNLNWVIRNAIEHRKHINP